MPTPIQLGEVDLPEGILVILDPGLSRFWKHDQVPSSPVKSDPPMFDLEIVGADAEIAGKLYDREFDPLYLFDQRDPEKAGQHFAEFARENELDAAAKVLDKQMPHVERARRALEAGRGFGVVKYNGLWGVVVGGMEPGQTLRVQGIPMPTGEFSGRFESIDLIVDGGAAAAQSDNVAGVMVDHGQFLFSGLEPLGHFRMWESIDGLADYVFWGADAERLAGEMEASDLGGGQFGWRDLPVEKVGEVAGPIEERREKEGLKVGVDFRPHCNLERLNAQVRESGEGAGQIDLAGSRVVGCDNRWGDGVFEVSRYLDGAGRPVLIRMELATPQRLVLFRKIMQRRLGAIATKFVLEKGEPVRFGERMNPSNPQDSGWFFSSGLEDEAYMDDAANMALVPLGTLIERFPKIEEFLDLPVGTCLKGDGETFEVDEE